MWTKLELQGITVLNKLEEAGYEAYFVGGYVRDKVWGKPVKDIDIATSALPEEVVRLFDKTIPTGLKHGTITVMIEGTAFEVTTYRKESDYADFRRPTEVEFISELEEDLKRRDFTMNAMAMDSRGGIRDPFHGQADMEMKLLRCVGDPLERFQEDALRMMRCVRFASTYDLSVDSGTWQALFQRRALLRHVAMERVRVEMERMMAGPMPYRGWELLLSSGLLGYTKEKLEWSYKGLGEGDPPAFLKALEALEQPIHRWIAVLLESGLDAEETKLLLKQMTFSAKDMERISKAVAVDRWVQDQDWSASLLDVGDINDCSAADRWKLASLQFGLPAMEDWLSVWEAAASMPEFAGIKLPDAVKLPLAEGRRWLLEMPLRDLKELKVSGQELIRHSGQAAGPWVGITMARLLRLTALGRLPNSKEILLAASSDAGKSHKDGGSI